MEFKYTTLSEKPELARKINSLHLQFPRFVTAGDKINRHYWSDIGLYEHFPDFQFALSNTSEDVASCGHSIPLVWNGTLDDLPTGYDDALQRGFECLQNGMTPNTLCALAAITGPQHKGQGLSYQIINAMKSIAKFHHLTTLIAPVRPTWKDKYPLTPMGHYVRWLTQDGSPFDPWLRVHLKLGGVYLCVAEQSMVITGSVKEWGEWTNMVFPESGEYVIPQAFNPIQIDLQTDYGLYVEPNVWIQHSV